MTNLWLIRHAQPLVAQGICYGATDVPADGIATQTAAAALAQALPSGTRVVSSPLQRCEQLMQALQPLRPDLTYQRDARLKEMDFGNWEGRHWDAIDRAELDAWTAEFETWRCGSTGECVQDVMHRVAAVWDETVDPAENTARDAEGTASSPAPPTAWITHAGVIRAAMLIAQGVRRVTDASQWPKDAPGFGQWRCQSQSQCSDAIAATAGVNPAAPRCTPPPRSIF